MDGFYVAYEYGSGAAWAFVRAETAEEVVAELPELDVYDTPPSWMTIEDLHHVREHASLEIDRDVSIDHVLQRPKRERTGVFQAFAVRFDRLCAVLVVLGVDKDEHAIIEILFHDHSPCQQVVAPDLLQRSVLELW